MDPMLAQGFSSLTKALIGDPETDYQVARTNRVNELLPLEKQQIEAQIGGSNASAAAARALQTLRQAQTLTEDQMRNPLVQTEIANAKAVLALAGERDANAAQTTALTPSMIAENKAKAESSLAQAFKFNADGTQTAALTPSIIAENQAGADEKSAAADLSRAKIDSEGRVILNAGQTIRTTNAAGEVETYTAPENVEVTLDPGQEAVIINADGTQTRIKGPEGTKDPKDGAERLKIIDAQLQEFFDADDFSEVPKSLLLRIRSNTTNAAKDKDIEEVSAQLQALLSQTFRGNSVFTVTTRSNFSVPAFIANAARDSRMTVSKVVELYGLSADQAKRLLKDVRAQ